MEPLKSPKSDTNTKSIHEEVMSPKYEEKTTANYYLPEAHRHIKAVIISIVKLNGTNLQ